MTKLKTALACVLSIVLIMGLLPVSASIEQEVTITVSEVTAEPGTTVEVPVVLSGNNMGLVALKLLVSYNNSLTLKKAKQGDALSSLDMNTSKSLTENPYTITLDGTDADSTNGTIFILTFAVPSDATGKLDINLSYNVGDIYDNDMNDVNPKIINGGVIIESPVTEPTLEINNLIKGTSEITLDVNLTSPTDIKGKVVVALYDNNGLVKLKMYDATKSTINVVLDAVNGDYIKAFWWDLNTFFPFADTIKTNL